MRLLITVIGLSLISFALPSDVKFIVKDGTNHVEYFKRDGMLHGKYVSFWPNGHKKAEGKFVRNHRVGTWLAWDSTGTHKIKVDYKESFVNAYVPGSASRMAITTTTRLWRFAPYDANAGIFERNILLDTLMNYAWRTPYNVAYDDEMINRMLPQQYQDQLNKCGEPSVFLGYRIKEDWFYDSTMAMAHYGVVSICPVFLAGEKDSVELGWFSYENLYPVLAKMKAPGKYRSRYVITMADLLCGHDYASFVYRSLNSNGARERFFNTTSDDPKFRSNSWDFLPYEWEHELWVK